MSANNHLTTVGTGRGDWQTPRDLWERMRDRWQLNYDAFASHENALCDVYSTEEGTYRKCWRDPEYPRSVLDPNARRETWVEQISTLDGMTFIPGDDGPLWRFANPPYSRGIVGAAVESLATTAHLFKNTVGLLPENRDTSWWRSFIKNKATVYSIGRVRYIDPSTGEPGGSPPGGSAIVVWLPEWLDR